MRVFPGFYQIIKVKAPSQPIDLIPVLINDIGRVIVDRSSTVKINCVRLVPTDERRIIKLVPHILAHCLMV